uniref:SAM-dependent methyltransferase n=1 Tax=Sciscionella sediminilitoris TaxID=1445613 RepID=UPI00055CFE5E
VVYVDSEPVAVTHARRTLDGDENCLVVEDRLPNCESVLTQAGQLLDFTEPMAVMLVAILHFVSDEDDPEGITARYAKATAPGSYLIASHGTAEGAGAERVRKAAAGYRGKADYSAYLRTKEEFAAILAPYDLVEPGITWTAQWHPEDDRDVPADADHLAIYAAVGRK